MAMQYTGEPKRGCGHRKLGGLYLVGDPAKQALPCQVMPYPLLPCDCCGQTVNFSRGYTWVRPAYFATPCKQTTCPAMGGCVFTAPARVQCEACSGEGTQYNCDLDKVAAQMELEGFEQGTQCKPCQGTGNAALRVGLLWVGREFYPEASGFIEEAVTLGVSKRLATVPRNLVLGKTWVMLARKHDQPCPACPTDDLCEVCEGKRTVSSVFYAFKPSRLEMIVTADMLVAQCKACQGAGCNDCDKGTVPSPLALRCERQHITPVIVDPADLEEVGGSDED